METIVSALTNIDSATTRPISRHRGKREWKAEAAGSYLNNSSSSSSSSSSSIK